MEEQPPNSKEYKVPDNGTDEVMKDAEVIQEPQFVATPINLPSTEPIEVTGNIKTVQRDGWTIANFISFAALVISALLFYYTYRLFGEATKQSQAASKAADVAVSSYLAGRYNDSTAAIRQNNLDIHNRAEDERRHLTDSENLDAQIKSLKTTQADFAIENQPYLQIKEATMDSIDADKPLKINFTIENLGKYPARITETRITFRAYRTSNPDDVPFDEVGIPLKEPPFYIRWDSLGVINRIIKDDPIAKEISYHHPIGRQLYPFIQNHKDYEVKFEGWIKYINLVNGKPKIYRFDIRLKAITGAKGEFFINENKDDKKKMKL